MLKFKKTLPSLISSTCTRFKKNQLFSTTSTTILSKNFLKKKFHNNYNTNTQRNYSTDLKEEHNKTQLNNNIDNNNNKINNNNTETKQKSSLFKRILFKTFKYSLLFTLLIILLIPLYLVYGSHLEVVNDNNLINEKVPFLTNVKYLFLSYLDSYEILTRFFLSVYTIVKIMLLYRELNKEYNPKLEALINRQIKKEEGDVKTVHTMNTNNNNVNTITSNRTSPQQQVEEELKEEEETKILKAYIEARKEVNLKTANLLLNLCLKNGGAYVKAGQYIASLNYILPKEFTDTLSVLTDKCNSHSFEETERILREEFEVKDYSEIFKSFNKEPIASASIAQVHLGELKDGTKVAIKIQHPDLFRIFKIDLKTMQFLLNLTKTFFDFPFSWTLPEFERILLSELDFVNEGANCQHFKNIFQNYDQIDAPKIYWNLTSKKVLTMEYINGVKLNDFESLKKLNISPMEISKLLVESYSIQAFIHGFIHSDIHLGNLLVRKGGKEVNGKTQLIYLDHGCYKKLDEETRIDFCNLWKAAIFRDHENLKKYTERFGIDGRFYPLFGLFLTFSNYMDTDNKAIVDQRKLMSKEEVKKMFIKIRDTFFPGKKRSPQEFFNVVENMFKNMKLDLILLMRTNVQLRSITKELGKPINRFAIMAEYCLKGIYYERKNHFMHCIPHRLTDSKQVIVTHVIPTPFFHKLTLQLLRLNLNLLLMDMAFYFATLSLNVIQLVSFGKKESEEEKEMQMAKHSVERMRMRRKEKEEEEKNAIVEEEEEIPITQEEIEEEELN
ncbi:hypothetical protein ABK040_006378 [Willaertia magna]